MRSWQGSGHVKPNGAFLSLNDTVLGSWRLVKHEMRKKSTQIYRIPNSHEFVFSRGFMCFMWLLLLCPCFTLSSRLRKALIATASWQPSLTIQTQWNFSWHPSELYPKCLENGSIVVWCGNLCDVDVSTSHMVCKFPKLCHFMNVDRGWSHHTRIGHIWLNLNSKAY